MKKFIGTKSIVRTYSAGVHFGDVESIDGTSVVLNNARRIWYWDGAFTLNAVANHGVNKNSKLSEPVATILLIQAIEVIPMSDEVAQKLYEHPSHE